MEKNWIPLIAVSLGGVIAIIGAYVNGAIQLRRQQKIERKKILLTKLEETYETVIAVQQGITTALGEAVIRLTPGQLPLERRNTSTTLIPLEKLRMLVTLYFDDLKTPLEAVVRGRDKLGEYFASSIVKQNATESERMRLKSEMLDMYPEVVRTCDEFLLETLKLVKKLL